VSRQSPPPPPLSRRERRRRERDERPSRDRPKTSTRHKRRPVWQSPFALVSALALVVAVVLIVLNQKPAPSTAGSELVASLIAYRPDQVDGDVVGSADAPVVLEVYSDFQCPVCGRFIREQYPTLKTQLVDTGMLRIQARDVAFLGARHSPDESLELATGALCAGKENRYWAFHDLVFANQGRENRGDYSAEFIAAVADRAGVDRAAWDDCIAGDEVRSTVRTQTQTALGMGINATPTLVLNGGTPAPGIPDLAELIARIQTLAGAGASASPTSSATP
jgi:protein-disulfide isomerase